MAAEHRPNLALHRELVAAKKAAGGVGEKQAVADRVRALMGSAPVFSVEKDGSAVVALVPGALPARTEAIGLPAKPPIDSIAAVADTSTGVWGAKLADSTGTYAITSTAVSADGAGLKIPAAIDEEEAVALSGSIAIPDPLTGADDEPEVPDGQRDALVQPFASTSPWLMPIGSGAVYGGTSTQLSQIRTAGATAVSPSTASNRMWCMPIAIATASDPEKKVGVYSGGSSRTITLRIPEGFEAALPYPSYSGIPGAPSGNGGDGHMTVRWRDAQGRPWIDEFYGARRLTGQIPGIDYIAKGWIRISARKHGIGYGGVSPPGGWPVGSRPWNGDASFVVPSGSVGWEDMTAAKTDTPGEDGTTGSVRAYGGSASAGAYTTGDFDHEDGPQHAGSVSVPHRVQRRQVSGQCNLARWPARRNDCVLYGTDGQLEQGMLLAIPWDTPETGFTGDALKLLRSWKRHGIYIVDQSSTSASDTGTFNIYCNPEAPDVCTIMLGLRDSGQLQALRNLLTLVTNNTAANRGGGGTPRASLLPEAF